MYPQDPNQQPNQPPAPAPAPAPQPDLNQDYSVDYLNQISAPVKQTRTQNPKFLYGLIVGLLALLLIVGGFLIISNRTTPMDKATDMLLRMQTLERVAKNQHKHLRDSQLRSTNSAYTLFLANAIRDIKEPLESAEVNLNKLPRERRDAEKLVETDLTGIFDEARLNVTLDRAYAREMSYQLDVLHGMMTSVYNATNSTTLKEYLESSETNLAQISEGFSNFSGTK